MSLEGLAIQLEHHFEIITCYKCQMAFAVPAAVRQRWLDSGDSFYCPAGHGQHYTEAPIQKLQKQLAQTAAERDWARQNATAERSARERTQRQLRAVKGSATRLRNRVKHGVCPCCRRSFGNLRRHMSTQHPDFND